MMLPHSVRDKQRLWSHAYKYEEPRRLSKEFQKRYHVLPMGGRGDIAQ